MREQALYMSNLTSTVSALLIPLALIIWATRVTAQAKPSSMTSPYPVANALLWVAYGAWKKTSSSS